jgi:hypothetical protein
MKKLLALFFILTVLSLPGLAADWLQVHGYYKTFFVGLKEPGYKGQDKETDNAPMGAASNRLRLKLSAKPLSWLSLDAAYDFSPRIQDLLLFNESVFITPSSPLSYRLEDFPSRLYPRQEEKVGSFGVFHNLDRLFLTIKTRAADIFIGRQAIAWGSGHVFNPTDVVAPYAFNELDKEERQGVDAVRVRVPLGRMDELDMGYIFGRHFQARYSAVYIRGKTYILKTDIAGLVMRFKKNLLFGLDLTRSVGGAGAWFEAAYVLPYRFANDDDLAWVDKKYRENYLRASFGMDYNFSGRFYGFFEYHYNSAGMRKAIEYTEFFRTIAFQEGSVYLMGEHYLDIGFTFQVTPLIPFSSMVIMNFTDGSLIFSPNLEYNIAENIYLSFGAYFGVGKGPGLVALSPDTQITRYYSEFGAYPAMLYTSFRIYF